MFQALGGLAEKLEQIKLEQEKGEVVSVLGDVGVDLAEAEQRVKEQADHTNYRTLYGRELETIKDRTEQRARDIGLSERGKKLLHQERQKLFVKATIEAVNEEGKRRIQHQRAEATTSLVTLANLAARDPAPEGRERWEAFALSRIESMKGKAISEPEAVALQEKFKNQVRRERAEFFVSDLQDQLDDFTNKALRDRENVAQYELEGSRLIRQTGTDFLPPEKVGEAVSRYKDAVYSSAVKGNIERDPGGTLAELKAGKYDKALEQRSIIALRNEAENEVERLQRKAEAERRQYEREIGQEVEDYETAVTLGFDWAGNEDALARRVRGTKHEPKFIEARTEKRVFGHFNQMPTALQEEYLRELSTGPKTGSQAQLHTKLQTAHQRAKAALKDDPLTFAVRARVIPPLPPLDLDNPETLRVRSSLAGIASERYGVPVSPLTDDETEQLRNNLQQMPPDGKVRAFRGLRAGLDDRGIKEIASKLAKKKDAVLALTMGLSLEAPQAASTILKGQTILASDAKLGLAGAALTAARERINQNLGAAYLHNVEHHAAITDAALAAYAARSMQARDLSGVLDTGRMDEAVNEVTGGLLSIGGGFFSRGYKIQPPRYGMKEDEFKQALSRADFSKAKGLSAKDIINSGTLESIGDGKYLVRVGARIRSRRGRAFCS